MRIVTYGAACSVDGFIAGPEHELDWLHWSADVQRISAKTWATTDIVVMGRKTYEAAVRAGGGAYPGVMNYVFSRTLPARREGRLEIVAEDPVEMVRRLKGEVGGGICVMGGGEIARPLLAAGLVDLVGLNIHPVLLGEGIRMFPEPGKRVDLEVVEYEPIAHGCTYVLYRVRNDP